MQTTSQPVEGFATTGLSPAVLALLRRTRFSIPTPIQEQAIPPALDGRDLIGIAQTGTGKTLAFGLPIIDKLRVHEGRALIVVPTRELALQVQESIDQIARFLQPAMRSACLIGGAPMARQVRDLQARPRIIVATPGRLIDHMSQRTVDLSTVTILVLDEADRMFDMGFAPQIKRILDALPAQRQTMLFSATMPAEIARLASQYLCDPARIEVTPPGSDNTQVQQELCYVSPQAKPDLLEKLLADHNGTVLVFSRTKHGAKKLTRQVQRMGHAAAEIHSNRTLSQRRQALEGFKSGLYRVLVATDIAARGIDVRDIALVVNYDLPETSEDYIHRIGRTGRAGRVGHAISFATHEQYKDVQAIERLIKRAVPLSRHSESPDFRFTPQARPAFRAPSRNGQNRRRPVFQNGRSKSAIPAW